MKYFLDTEFHEYKKNGVDTIELISIGIVAEDGREYYAVCNEFDIHAAMNNDWLRLNVLRPIHNELEGVNYTAESYGTSGRQIAQWMDLFASNKTKSKSKIAYEILRFVGGHSILNEDNTTGRYSMLGEESPQFYGYYSDYDWVVFCWLFGRMIDLPEGFPMYCIDLKQILDETCEKKFLSWGINSGNFNMLTHIKTLPNYPQQENEHNALADARWNKQLHKFLIEINN